MMSAFFAASATGITVMPSFVAASQLFPLRRPMITSRPLSRRFRDCPLPCEPYPITAIFFPFSTERSASDS